MSAPLRHDSTWINRQLLTMKRHPHRRYLLRTRAPGFECRWPVEGAGAMLIVCGAPVPDGKAYCPACRQRAYQPNLSRSLRKIGNLDATIHRAKAVKEPAEASEQEPDLVDVIGGEP